MQRTMIATRSASLARSTGSPPCPDAHGLSYPLAAGDVTFGPKLQVTVEDPTQSQPAAKALPGPIVFAPGTQPLELGRPYRGQIQVSVVNGKLRAVDFVGLEPYLE